MRTQTAQQDQAAAEFLFATMTGNDLEMTAVGTQLDGTRNAAVPGSERDNLVLTHLSLVRFVARRIHERVPAHIELDDLIAAGLLGLIDAATSTLR